MRNKIFSAFLILVFVLLIISPINIVSLNSFALHDETATTEAIDETTHSEYSVSIYGYLDNSVQHGDVVLHLRNLTTGEEFAAVLYNTSGYYAALSLPAGAEYEIYDGYIVCDDSVDDKAAKIEYVRFKCSGPHPSIRVPIIIGEPENLEKIPPDPLNIRVNAPGQQYSNYPVNINQVIKTAEGETETKAEIITAPTFSHSSDENNTTNNPSSPSGTQAALDEETTAGEISPPATKKNIAKIAIPVVLIIGALSFWGIWLILNLKK